MDLSYAPQTPGPTRLARRADKENGAALQKTAGKPEKRRGLADISNGNGVTPGPGAKSALKPAVATLSRTMRVVMEDPDTCTRHAPAQPPAYTNPDAERAVTFCLNPALQEPAHIPAASFPPYVPEQEEETAQPGRKFELDAFLLA
jgi:hypothetical protein